MQAQAKLPTHHRCRHSEIECFTCRNQNHGISHDQMTRKSTHKKILKADPCLKSSKLGGLAILVIMIILIWILIVMTVILVHMAMIVILALNPNLPLQGSSGTGWVAFSEECQPNTDAQQMNLCARMCACVCVYECAWVNVYPSLSLNPPPRLKADHRSHATIWRTHLGQALLLWASRIVRFECRQ